MSRLTRLREGTRALACETGAPWPLRPRDARAPERVRAWSVLALPPRAALTFATTPLDPLWVAEVAATAKLELPQSGEEWVRPWTPLLWLVVDALATSQRLPEPATAAADWAAVARRGLDPERLSHTAADEIEALTGRAPAPDWSWPLPARSDTTPRRAGTHIDRWWRCVRPERTPAYAPFVDNTDWARQLQGAGVDDDALSGWKAITSSSARSAATWARLRAARWVRERWLPAVLVGDGDPTLAAKVAVGRISLEDARAWRRRGTPAVRRSVLAAAGYRADDPSGDATPDADLDVLAALRL